MRNILYRGIKELTKGEWVYGSLIEDKYIVGDIVEFNEDYFTTEFWWSVYDHTVGQYIGREDKNGVKIFKGDLIKLRSGRITKVEWFEENYSFDLSLYTSVLDQEGGCDLSEVEIIGNIHEMKYLLEVTK